MARFELRPGEEKPLTYRGEAVPASQVRLEDEIPGMIVRRSSPPATAW